MTLAATLLLECALAGHALEPTTPLASYGRQSWAMENGLPQNTVQALIQTRDGFVWLGTEVGLVRFDGNSFQVFDRSSSPALPGSDVRCLLESQDGTLWIGTSEGLARWRDGNVTAFTVKDGLPGNGVRALWQATDGGVRVETDGGLARLLGTQFVKATNDSVNGAGENGLSATFIDGKKVVGSKSGVQIESTFELTVQLSVGKELPGSKVQVLFTDREDGLWIGTNGGLARWAQGKLELLPVTDPLASASVLALMEDREGNIWAGTETGGLHILRDQRFRTRGAREGLTSDATTTVVEDGAGTLWVGTNGSGLNAIPANGAATVQSHSSHKDKNVARVGRPEKTRSGHNDTSEAKPGQPAIKSYTVKDGLLSDVILSLAAAPNGDLWIGTPDGLNRIRGRSVASFSSADGLPDDFIRSLLADADGSLWVGTRRGLTHWTNPGSGNPSGRMETFTQANGLGSDLVGSMVRDGGGDLWVATLAGLSRLHGGKILNYTTANGLSSNVVTALLSRPNGTMLIGTQDQGWNVWDGNKFSKAYDGGLDLAAIHAILDDGGGHLWFATGNGIARCDSAGMDGAIGAAVSPDCTHWMQFGANDGLRSRETATNSHPSAWRSRDGRLWFATPKGLVEADPAHFPVNTLPPPVELERFTVDDVAMPLHAADSRLRFDAGHVHFEFDYAGLSYTAPQKVRYRYMLEGFDRDWIEAGTRRTAYYTAIPPGRYIFHVQAANNDGVWNRDGAKLAFVLRPHFYQTKYFYLLMLALAVGMVMVLLRLRLRRAEGEFHAVLGERSRIAREIHDTLAQGYVGISVQLEVLAELLRQHKTEAAAKHLDLTCGYVREGLAEARQSIWALRSQDSDETTLPVKLRRMVEAERGAGLKSEFSVFGAYRPLPSGTEREILRVAQEAIHNVKKHAAAKHLYVQLEYGPAKIALEVRDDGRGFEPEASSVPGHFGLTGMRERAKTIDGVLEVTSNPGGGTIVRLRAAAIQETREN
jgi:ligand-binding sensor domain-containing protein